MSTAQVANSGIVGSSARIPLSRHSVSSSSEYVDSLGGAYAPPPRDQWHRFDDDAASFDSNPRHRGHHGRFQDNVVSFGGVLVSREVGTTIMQAQAAQDAPSASKVLRPKVMRNHSGKPVSTTRWMPKRVD